MPEQREGNSHFTFLSQPFSPTGNRQTGSGGATTMSQTWLFAPPTHANHVTGTHHPETAARTTRIIRALEQDVHVQTACQWGTPRPATTDELARVHTPDHLARVAEAGRAAQARQQLVALDPDTVMSAGSYEAAGDAAGAVLAAVEAIHQGKARRAFVVARPPGHHATPNRAMGFCLFNNVAVGARHAQHLGFQRVLIVDWDVHHGNGTQDIFYADPSVFFFSIHQFPHYPGTGSQWECGVGPGEGFTLNVPLRAGMPAAVHLEAFEAGLETITSRFHPDFVFISAGFDAHAADPLGNLNLTDRDFVRMTHLVNKVADRFSAGRLVSVLEGGYNLDTLPQTVCHHVAALAGVAEETLAAGEEP
jgi:acetoin utilization deacetylase AcuC-like enzyme